MFDEMRKVAVCEDVYGLETTLSKDYSPKFFTYFFENSVWKESINSIKLEKLPAGEKKPYEMELRERKRLNKGKEGTYARS